MKNAKKSSSKNSENQEYSLTPEPQRLPVQSIKIYNSTNETAEECGESAVSRKKKKHLQYQRLQFSIKILL